MEFSTDVLIVGGGPTGLMMACQLTRFGVSFRIIDKDVDRAKESRAIAVQAKSMELFQNLGLDSQFLSRAIVGTELKFYSKGKVQFKIDFSRINSKNTPFPSIYFLPQSDTEEILLTYLDQLNYKVERQTELLSFTEKQNGIEAVIKNNQTGENETIHCKYLVGCDGAHSRVREQMDIPFVGGSYQQKLLLADVCVNMSLPKNRFAVFMSEAGILLSIPLYKGKVINRLIMASFEESLELPERKQLTLEEIGNLAKTITCRDINLSNPIWISPFFLHHRAVKQYQKGLVFIAGDAAHIHSPVGGQGMNTGLQDASNLAWKIALVIKYNASEELLETYQTERQRIGEILLKTTDKIFGLIISRRPMVSIFRQHIFPFVMGLLTKWKRFNDYLFHFISELGIRYHENPFVTERVIGADIQFLRGPKAGCRAPDAPINHTTLFELFQQKPINVLLLQSEHYPWQEEKVKILEQFKPELIAVHKYMKSKNLKLLFDRYGVTSDGIYCIRPDGYIGFRAFGYDLDSLLEYLNKLFGKIVSCSARACFVP